MSLADPSATTVGELCLEAIKESGALGLGQDASDDDLDAAQVRLQWMLQEWQRKRYMVYHLLTALCMATGNQTYSVGPGGQFDTGPGSSRPDKIESAFLRQLVSGQDWGDFGGDFGGDFSGGALTMSNNIDTPLALLHSMEDYARIGMKGLGTFSSAIFYDPMWPVGTLFPWPIPQASRYAIGIVIKAPLPVSFAGRNARFNLPFEYFNAIVYNLAMRLRSYYRIPAIPGDALPGLAKDGMQTIRGANGAIAALSMPIGTRTRQYNIFSDNYS